MDFINLDTKNILFICGGAFDGLDKVISSRIGKKGLGFGADVEQNNKIQEDILQYVEPEDLLHYGLIPELIGRLPVISTLTELDEKALFKILTTPKNALTKQYKRLFEMDEVELTFDNAALKEIVKIAKKRGTGARGLRSVMEEVMKDIMFSLPSQKEVASCRITRDVVHKKGKPVLKKKKPVKIVEAEYRGDEAA